MKLKREALIHYLNAEFNTAGENPDWAIIGKDIDDMSVSLNPDIEKKKNILGENSVADNGYEPELGADPYYADPEDKLYQPIRSIALERKKGDECKTQMLEVIIENPSAESHLAFVEDVIVKPQSYGGGTEGVNIPFNVTNVGNRTKGTVKIVNKIPTFTADATAAAEAEAGEG